MSTPFLNQFSQALIAILLNRDLLEVVDGGAGRVATYLAGELASCGSGNSLLSSVERSLIKCEDVVEFYADLETMKEIVQTLKYGGDVPHSGS